MTGLLRTLLALLKIGVVVSLLTVFFVLSGYLSVRWALSGEETEVPRVVGLEADEARRVLEAEGLIAELTDERLADVQVPEGNVLRQNPPAGSQVKRQRGVRLTLSSGPPERMLPLTVGNVFTQARIQMEQQEIEVVTMARVHSNAVGADRVIAQRPDPAAIEPGEPMPPARLLVSMGPPPRRYVMPDLLGLPLDRVRGVLEGAGFRLAPVDEIEQRGVEAGRVLLQSPSAGFPVEAGATIELTVSR